MNCRRAVRSPVLLLIFLTALSSYAEAATPVRLVKSISFNGQGVDSASVTVKRGSVVEHSIRRGEPIADGTRIDVPANTIVVLERAGKSTVTLEAGASVTFVSTGTGETISNNGGKSLFSVIPGALDFFRVQSGESLTASVHGTDFWVDNETTGVTFKCDRGEVNIEKTGYLQVGDRRLRTSLIDVISAERTSQATYNPTTDWTLAKFNNFAEADAFYQQAVDSAKKSGDDGALNAAKINLANVQRLEGFYDKARRNYEDALAFYASEGDLDRQAAVLNGIGLTLGISGHNDDALDSLNRALALYRNVGDVDGEGDALNNIGNLYRTEGKHDKALLALHEALQDYRVVDDVEGQARVQMDTGIVHYSTGGLRRLPHRRLPRGDKRATTCARPIPYGRRCRRGSDRLRTPRDLAILPCAV